MTLGQVINVGPFSFTVVRVLVLVGFVRVLLRRERPFGGMVGMDWLLLWWAAWALCASGFHNDVAGTFVNHLGMVYNALGTYFLMRCFCYSFEDVVQTVVLLAFLLVPIAVEMLQEQWTGRNIFSVFGGVEEAVTVRGGRIRSQGPFAHAILAGTVGAVSIPLLVGVMPKRPWTARMGIGACLLMIVASSSSGPLMSALFAAIGLVLWKWRRLTRQIRILCILGYVLLDIVMKAPAYYLIARIDLTGSSTGYHRARLIESSIEHISEWWWAGTDYTRHWMPTGVSWSEDHTDITNQYLAQGVRGGLPLTLLFMAVIWLGFRYVGEGTRQRSGAKWEEQFLMWSLGASLFAHAASFLSVSYFDQSVVFFYVNMAAIAALWASVRRTRA